MFYNWRARKARNAFTKKVTVPYLVKQGLPAEQLNQMSREVLSDLYSCVMLGMALSGGQPLGVIKSLPEC